MINTVEVRRFFECHQIARLLDDADGGLVASGVAADRADGLIGLGEVEADLAMADLLFGVADGLGKLEGSSARGIAAGGEPAARPTWRRCRASVPGP